MGKGVVWKVTPGGITTPVEPVDEDTAGPLVLSPSVGMAVGGKVASFEPRVKMNGGGVTLWRGLITYVAVSVGPNVTG